MPQHKVNLIPLTDAWMTRPRISKPRKPAFYPSEASAVWKDSLGVTRTAGACLRSAWYRVTGVPDGFEVLPNDPYTEWIFALGKAVEVILVEQWKQMGLWVANNVEFYDPVKKISGEIDVILCDPSERSKLYGVEVKSFYGYQGTKEVCGNKSTQARPKTSQLMQTLIYADQFPELDYFKMIYYARDSANRNEFDITITNDGGVRRPTIDGIIDHRFSMEDIYSRYRELDEYIEAQVMPPADYELHWDAEKVEQRNSLGEVAKTRYADWKKNPSRNPMGDWQCSYCRYKNICWPR